MIQRRLILQHRNQWIVFGKSESVPTSHNLSSTCPNNYSLGELLADDIVADALSGKHSILSVSSRLSRNSHFGAYRVHIWAFHLSISLCLTD